MGSYFRSGRIRWARRSDHCVTGRIAARQAACRGAASRRFARLAVHPHGGGSSIRMETPLPSASVDSSVPGRPRHLWGGVVRFLSLSIPMAFLSSLLTRWILPFADEKVDACGDNIWYREDPWTANGDLSHAVPARGGCSNSVPRRPQGNCGRCSPCSRRCAALNRRPSRI